jgi:hypothetical protein
LAVVTLKTLSNVQQCGSHWISHGIKANEPAKKLYTQLHSHACEIYKHCRCCICMCLLPLLYPCLVSCDAAPRASHHRAHTCG